MFQAILQAPALYCTSCANSVAPAENAISSDTKALIQFSRISAMDPGAVKKLPMGKLCNGMESDIGIEQEKRCGIDGQFFLLIRRQIRVVACPSAMSGSGMARFSREP
jgi:hypothetical protein